MKRVASKIKPKSGFSYFVHLFFVALIPTLMYIAVRVDLELLGLLIVLLGKWRVFSVRPRHWWANIRANAVDMLVGVSMLIFMIETQSVGVQAIIAVFYGLWLLLLKPRSGPLFMAIQAVTAQALGSAALFLIGDSLPAPALVIMAGMIGYLSTRHFFFAFEEPHAALFAHTWGYFCASLAWILSHWMLYYVDVIAQFTVLTTVIGFSLGALYYLEQTDKLSKAVRRQILFLLIAIVVVIIVYSDWSDRAI